MLTVLFGTILPWLLLLLVCWLVYQLLRQNGRILLRLEALEEQLGHPPDAAPEARAPSGLNPGAAAPDFELPDLASKPVSLGHWRGRRILLVFFNPRCGFCEQMAPGLAALKADGSDGRPLPVLITSGGAEMNRRFMDEHGIHCPVLVESKDSEVSSRYQAGGTPMGYLIDEDGVIATPLTVGAEALLALAAIPAAPAADGGHEPASKEQQEGRSKGKANRGLHTSRLRRDGLEAGTAAPPFRLPKLDGGELALEDFRGRRVLLVFSDPDCGPCAEVAPALEQLHQSGSGVQVLMISRRDPDANRAKVAELGLTFPVVLQRHWEISMQYGMFATPIAYLIDEDGVLATDVMAGPEPIRQLTTALASNPPAPSAEANGAARLASS